VVVRLAVYGGTCRPIDQDGQVIGVLVSARRDANSGRWLFRRALKMLKVTPSEAVTDAAATYQQLSMN